MPFPQQIMTTPSPYAQTGAMASPQELAMMAQQSGGNAANQVGLQLLQQVLGGAFGLPAMAAPSQIPGGPIPNDETDRYLFKRQAPSGMTLGQAINAFGGR